MPTPPVNWVSVPDGSDTTYGYIPEIHDAFDAELCCPAGKIRLPVGNIAHGLIHLESKKRFDAMGATTFVYSVTAAFDEIWVQKGRGGLLLLRCTGRRSVILSRPDPGGIYSVVTAFPLDRHHNHRRRREVRVWPR